MTEHPTLARMRARIRREERIGAIRDLLARLRALTGDPWAEFGGHVSCFVAEVPDDRPGFEDGRAKGWADAVAVIEAFLANEGADR